MYIYIISNQRLFSPISLLKTLYGLSDSIQASRLAIQLKQILDGKGLFIQINLLPQENDYIDSTTQRALYTPFPNELPSVFLEKKEDDKWYYSTETINQIPKLHKVFIPLDQI